MGKLIKEVMKKLTDSDVVQNLIDNVTWWQIDMNIYSVWLWEL